MLEQDVHRRGSHAAGPGGRDAPAVLRAAQRTGARKAGMVMQKLAAVPPPPPERTTAVPFALWCGMPPLAQLIVRHLIPMGFVDDPQAATLLVLDAPVGFALRALETHALAARSVIVATGSPCPEYWADLADCDPAILLAGPDLEHAIATALRHAPHGARYQLTPPVQSPLTAQERAVLRAVARGYTNAQIARIVGVSPKRVANMLTQIYARLQLPNRVALALYYWGRADLLGVGGDAPSPESAWAGISSRADGN